MSDVTSDESSCNCKIGAVASRYDLEGIHGELRNRWLGNGHERMGIRRVTDYFNKTVFKRIIYRADVDMTSAEIERAYDVLTGDPDDFDLEYEQLSNRLERAGIGVDEIKRNDMVGKSTMHLHFRKCIDAEFTPEETTTEVVKDNIRQMEGRTETITRDNVLRKAPSGAVEAADLEFTTQSMVRCNDCGYFKRAVVYLDEGGCYCAEGG